MTIDSRDYMRDRFDRAWPPREPPWWKRFRLILVIVIAVLALGAAVWFMSSASRPTEGSLRVNINTATLTELESIPGIGDKLALLVVAGRPYQSVDELVKVRGIAEKKLENLRPYVKVDGKTEKLR